MREGRVILIRIVLSLLFTLLVHEILRSGIRSWKVLIDGSLFKRNLMYSYDTRRTLVQQFVVIISLQKVVINLHHTYQNLLHVQMNKYDFKLNSLHTGC